MTLAHAPTPIPPPHLAPPPPPLLPTLSSKGRSSPRWDWLPPNLSRSASVRAWGVRILGNGQRHETAQVSFSACAGPRIQKVANKTFWYNLVQHCATVQARVQARRMELTIQELH